MRDIPRNGGRVEDKERAQTKEGLGGEEAGKHEADYSPPPHCRKAPQRYAVKVSTLRVRALERFCLAMPDPRVRTAKLRNTVLSWSPLSLAMSVDQLAQVRARSLSKARQIWNALGPALISIRSSEQAHHLDEAQELASRHHLQWSTLLLSKPSAVRTLPKHGRLREVCIPARHRALTRGFSIFCFYPTDSPHDVDYLHGQRLRIFIEQLYQPIETFLAHPDPSAIAKMFETSWLTERDVCQIAARRPINEGLVEQLVSNPRWISRPKVQYALLTNPFLMPTFSLLLLPGASNRALNHIRRSPAFSETQREAARKLSGLHSDTQ